MVSALAKKWPQYWFYSAIGISLFCLTVTFFSAELQETSGLLRQLNRFNLARENNFGAWWSGILLLLASIHAFDGFFLHRKKQPSVAYAWASVSAVLLLLSLDEIGSIHERVDSLLHLGSWLSLLPFALILLSALAYGLLTLWRVPEQRQRVVWIVVAFTLLASVALQEYLEHHSQWWGPYSSLRVVIEEGSELLGMLILLKVSMGNTFGIFQQKENSGQPVLQILASFRTYLLVIGVLSAPVLAYVTAALPDQQRGHPADWLAAAGFLCAGLVIARRFFESGKHIGWGSWVLSITCWAMSAAAIAISPEIDPQKKFFVLYFVSLLICVIWILHAKQNKAFYWVPATVVIVMSVLSLIDTSLFLIYLLYPLVSLLTYYINATLGSASAKAPFTAFTKESAAAREEGPAVPKQML